MAIADPLDGCAQSKGKVRHWQPQTVADESRISIRPAPADVIRMAEKAPSPAEQLKPDVSLIDSEQSGLTEKKIAPPEAADSAPAKHWANQQSASARLTRL
jgi:hypothetical protein